MSRLFSLFAFLTLGFLSVCLAKEEGYKLRKEDQIRMLVYQEDELATVAKVGKSGSVSFPLIGNVKLEGLTVKQAETEIKRLYEKSYLVNAQVSVSVLKHADKWVIIAGEVGRPGTINFPPEGDFDLQAAIAQAGGFGDRADQTNMILRDAKGSSSLISITKDGERKLVHGDLITVKRQALSQSIVTVAGNVNRPGAVNYPKEGKLNVLTAIVMAGDFTQAANRNYAYVTRSGKQITINLNSSSSKSGKQFILQPGDFVLVREEAQTQRTVTVSGKVSRPGTVAYPKSGGLNIITAIAQAGGFSRLANQKSVVVRRGNQQFTVSIKDIAANKQKMFYLKPGDIVYVAESKW